MVLDNERWREATGDRDDQLVLLTLYLLLSPTSLCVYACLTPPRGAWAGGAPLAMKVTATS